MIRVRVLRSTVGDGGRVLGVGEQLSLPDAEVRLLLALGKVEVIAAVPEVAGAGAPVARHRDPAPARARARP